VGSWLRRKLLERGVVYVDRGSDWSGSDEGCEPRSYVGTLREAKVAGHA
jgi:hypothetical protein